MEEILLGTYTKKTSEGIYSIFLDSDKKTLSDLTLVAKEDNPTYLGVSHSSILYSVTKEEAFGGINVYRKEADGQYTLLQTLLEEGAPPCYIGIDNNRGLVFDANYHRGVIHSYNILSDGTLELVDTIQHTGKGPHENQKSPHAHYADLTPDGRLVVCDLGNDTITTYDVADNGQLSECFIYHTTPGAGPRHIVFHTNEKLAYFTGELDSTAVALSYDPENGSLATLQTLSTLPADYTEFNGTAAIRLSKDNKNLYISNRGHNSLAVFSLSEDGKHMTLNQIIATEGDFPRDFALNQDNKLLVCAHQNSDNLTLFERNMQTGELAVIEKDIYAPECVCTYFI